MSILHAQHRLFVQKWGNLDVGPHLSVLCARELRIYYAFALDFFRNQTKEIDGGFRV